MRIAGTGRLPSSGAVNLAGRIVSSSGTGVIEMREGVSAAGTRKDTAKDQTIVAAVSASTLSLFPGAVRAGAGRHQRGPAANGCSTSRPGGAKYWGGRAE
jgi:hypothetical protein